MAILHVVDLKLLQTLFLRTSVSGKDIYSFQPGNILAGFLFAIIQLHTFNGANRCLAMMNLFGKIYSKLHSSSIFVISGVI